MPRLITLAVCGMLLMAACTQEEIYTEDPAKIDALENTYRDFLNHYKEPDTAFDLLEKLRVLAVELENKEYLAKYYDNHGYLNVMGNQQGEAIKSYKLALALYGQLNDSLKQAKISLNLGNAYRRVERYSEALSYLGKAEKIYVQLDNKQKLPVVYDNLGLVYLELNQFDKAEYNISESLNASVTLNSPLWMYNAHLAYGELYLKQRKFDEAIKSYEKALNYLDNEQQLEKAYLYGNIGECYMKAGKLTKAKKWLTEALQLKNALDGADKRPNFNYLGELAVLKADYRAALRYYDQVVTHSTTDSELLSEELGTALDAIRDLSNNASVRASGIVIPVEKYSLIRDRKDKMLEEQYRLIQSKYDQESIEKAELEIAHLKESEQHKEDIAQFEKKTFTFQLSTLVTALLVVLSCLLIIAIIRKHRKEKRRLAGYESGLQVMMDKYGVSSIAELRELLSRMSE